jgi:hypothetical protein
MSQPIVADLLARIEELERTTVTSTAARRRTPRRRRLAIAAVALVGLLLIPAGVFAGHQFTDVPNSNTFHTSISRVKLAGITSGCSSTKFCPNDEVTRGQMAAFLARTAPRAETAFFADSLLTEEAAVLASFDIKAGEATGGTAALAITATVTVNTTDATGCPCTGAFYIDSDRAPYTSFAQYATITETNVDYEGTAYGIATTSITVLIQIPTGVTETVYLVGYLQDGAELSAYGEMVGTVALFDGLGSNVVIPSEAQGGTGSGPGARGER